jgi:hypothetical protein
MMVDDSEAILQLNWLCPGDSPKKEWFDVPDSRQSTVSTGVMLDVRCKIHLSVSLPSSGHSMQLLP